MTETEVYDSDSEVYDSGREVYDSDMFRGLTARGLLVLRKLLRSPPVMSSSRMKQGRM